MLVHLYAAVHTLYNVYLHRNWQYDDDGGFIDDESFHAGSTHCQDSRSSTT
jgi:hypothetical protein